MTVPAWLSFLFEWGMVSAALVGVYVIARWAYAWVWAIIRFQRVKKELSQMDRVSLEAIARMGRREQ